MLGVLGLAAKILCTHITHVFARLVVTTNVSRIYATLCHLNLTKTVRKASRVNFRASTTSVSGAIRYRRIETIKKKTRPIPRATALPLRAYGNFIYELLYNIPGTLDSVGVYCFTPQQLPRRALQVSFLYPTVSPSQSA